ncbi:MAG TPA: hypothetical protein DC049_15800, partial [Spirochaetia bacterium]|nr:hypothetical protein [Spirochaetia bacterium]
MQALIDNRRYLIEAAPPRQSAKDLEAELKKFKARYLTILERGHAVCITDNAMGHLSFQGTELIKELSLPTAAGRVLLHLNTYHSGKNLDQILQTAAELGTTDILVITGDGSERLPKLAPREIGSDSINTSSVDLIKYIHREYPGKFTLGAAYNQYEPHDFEQKKLEEKIRAGAAFIIT